MNSDRPADGGAPRLVVFLPCHTLDDFPTWLDDREADDLLTAWTAAWHPRLVAAVGMPGWASVDLPPPAGPVLGIVPATWDERFAAQFDATAAGDAVFVRATRGGAAITAAAVAAVAAPPADAAADRWSADFHALGLAVLLAELLARRMRCDCDFRALGLAAAVERAARAAVAGRDDEARAGLAECFGCLDASRARYYPVDAWLVDLVLLSRTTAAASLGAELESPVPCGVVADAACLDALASRDPDALPRLLGRVAEGRVSLCGGTSAARPLDALVPEELLDAASAEIAAWRDRGGVRPAVFARHAGGGSAILPQVLAGLDYAGAVWGTFDGAPLPDPGAGRILWEGTGGASIEALARPPLDARNAAALLTLPERLGDAMDHDHVAVVTFAHHAGTGSAWHGLLRRIGGWTTALGTFVAPDELFRRTAGAGTPVTFGPDAFPPTPVPAEPGGDPLGAAVDAAAAAAGRIVSRAAALQPACAAVAAAPRSPGPSVREARGVGRALAGWWGGPRRDDPDRVLESDTLRVEIHPETGGLLSVRRPGAGSNRLSQQLAVRCAEGYGRPCADAVGPGTTASGVPGIVSRGRLLDAAGRDAGAFVQGVSLAPGLPLAVLDVEVRLPGEAAAGRLAEHHVACRFAWHENEDVEIRRSVHAQAVPTERTRFTAPHFVEIVPAGPRTDRAAAVTILSGGLPWHVRSSPHVLDTILAAPVGSAVRRLAVGLGLERPWDAAVELLAGAVPGSGPRPGPAHVRIAVHGIDTVAGRVTRARIGLLESAGTAGTVRVEWGCDVVAATARELDGRPRPGSAVAIEGRAIVTFLRAHEWLAIDLEFAA